MNTLLKLEEGALLALAFLLTLSLDLPWWWFWLLLLTPDLSMLGYLHNPKTGAFLYNLFHHKGLAVAVYGTGTLLGWPVWQLVGLVLLGHTSLDRMFGYGLKRIDSFKHTHLGRIGSRA